MNVDIIYRRNGVMKMKDLGNKAIMSKNINRFMRENNVSAKEMSKSLGVPYTTFLSWRKGENYPRIDKIEAMAAYFGILKSDLIEEKTEERREMQKNNDTLANIIVRLRTDETFFFAVKALYDLEPEKLSGLSALLK